MSSKQPFTFEYELASLETVLETKIAKKYPFLFKRMPFNYVLVESDREVAFFLNQDPNKRLYVPVGGGVIEADHIKLWSWKIENLYDGNNKVHVTVQKE